MFGFIRFGRRTAPIAKRANPATAYAEALQAGWVPPPAAPVQEQVHPVLSAARHTPDSVNFLTRVYRNQQC